MERKELVELVVNDRVHTLDIWVREGNWEALAQYVTEAEGIKDMSDAVLRGYAKDLDLLDQEEADE